MTTEASEELVRRLGDLISEAHFKKLPDTAILDLLCEGNREMELFLPLDQTLDMCEVDTGGYVLNVASASLVSDIYCDWAALYNYTSLRHLVLTCEDRDIEYIHDEDLASMQLAVVNLIKLKTLVVRMVGMKQSAIDQITEGMVFPGQQLEVSYVVERRRKGGREQPCSLLGL